MDSFETVSVSPQLAFTPTGERIVCREAKESDFPLFGKFLARDIGLVPDALFKASQNRAECILLVGEVVHDSGSEVIAFACVAHRPARGEVAESLGLLWISVALRHRARGIATILIRKLKDISRRLNIHRIDALKEISAPPFLRSEGFCKRFHDSLFFKKKQFLSWIDCNGKTDFPKISPIPIEVLLGNIEVRLATPADKRQWSALILAVCGYVAGGTDMLRSTLCAKLRIVAVSRETGAVIAVLAADQGWIYMLACDTPFRCKGLGSFLLFCALEWMRESGGTSCSLTPLSHKAASFYSKWGFSEDSVGHTKKPRAAHEKILSRAIGRDGLLPQHLRFCDVVDASSNNRKRNRE